jgi:hypothetical protein
MESINELWLKFNEYSNKLGLALGRSSNIVGEYAEYLVHQHYGGELFNVSNSSADIKTLEGKLLQVKSRKRKNTSSTPLSVIRSWDFDFLIVLLFNENGAIEEALEVPVEVAKEYGKFNNHQNGWIITTSKEFLIDNRINNITAELPKVSINMCKAIKTAAIISNKNSPNERLFSNKEIQKEISQVAMTISEEDLDDLCNKEVSKDIFNIGFPLFIKCPKNISEKLKRDAVKDEKGISRWTWKFEFERNDFLYAITTQWLQRNDIKVKDWLHKHK